MTATTDHKALTAALRAGNEAAYAAFEATFAAVSRSQRENAGPADPKVWDTYTAAAEALAVTRDAYLTVIPVGGTYYSHAGPMIVTNLNYIDGDVSVYATSDGKPGNGAEWHEGAENEMVRYERTTLTANAIVTGGAHGYIDSVSRKIVQVG